MRAQWSSYTSYVLVTTGAVVGLGNIFQFPYFVSKFGGLFVLLYILCELFVTIPILFAELLIGRRGKQNPVGSISILSMESNASPFWRWIGWLCFIILFITLASYTVSVAFPLGYFFSLAHAVYTPEHENLATEIQSNLTSNFSGLEICFVAFLLATMAVIMRGINRGLEGISRITVPLYFIILIGLAIYSCTYGSFSAAVAYLFHINTDQSVITVLFAALTYAFFKLNVGMGSMIVYGSYLPYTVPIGKSTFIIVCLDAIVSLLAYFVIYPLASAAHVFTASSLSYQNSLSIFATLPHGDIIAALFFLAAVIAAWTVTITMAESTTITLIERFRLPRSLATFLVFCGAVIIGTVVVLSYNIWQQTTILGFSLTTLLHNLASNVLIPLSAFLIAIFAAWIVKRRITSAELGFSKPIYHIWHFLIGIIAPIAIVGISLYFLFG